MRRALRWIPAIAWAIVIFGFSGQNAGSSQQLSGGIAQQCAALLVSLFRLDPENVPMDLLEHLIRKAAHFTEYAVLGGMILFALGPGVSLRRNGIAVLIAALYACTDEYHQVFIDGRSGQMKDVLIDTAGALCGVLLLAFVIKMFRKKHMKIDTGPKPVVQ